MATMGDIRYALCERIGGLPDFEAYPFVPENISGPCAYIEPDRYFANYQTAFHGSVCDWRFLVVVLVSSTESEASQALLDQYLNPRGSLVSALQSEDIKDSLQVLSNNTVRVLTGGRYRYYQIGNGRYIGAQLSVQLYA